MKTKATTTSINMRKVPTKINGFDLNRRTISDSLSFSRAGFAFP
jgi:hypothetical protein